MSSLIKPIFGGCDKCIVFASNNEFVPVLTVMLQSIAANSSTANKYDIIILHEDITAFTQTVVNNLFQQDNICIRFYNVGKHIEGLSFYTGNKANFSKEAYFRLLIPWILDDAYKYALYIDGDAVVLKDIYDIFEYDLGDNLIGAVKDYWGICRCYRPGNDRRSYRESISLTNIDEYALSGTIIFNLRLFREKYTITQVMDLAASRNWMQHDQDVINLLCKNKIYHISAKWGLIPYYTNLFTYLPMCLQEELLQAKEDPIIIQFGGGEKPWIRLYVDYFLDFWRYALETPFFKVLFDKITSYEYKNYIANALAKENPEYMVCSYENNDVQRYFNGSELGLLSSGPARYRKIIIKDDTLYLEGLVGFFGAGLEYDIEVYLSVNDEMFPANQQKREDEFNEEKQIYTFRGEAFYLTYKLDSKVAIYSIKIVCCINGLPLEKNNIEFEGSFFLDKDGNHSWSDYEKWIVIPNGNALLIKYSDTTKCDKKTMESEISKYKSFDTIHNKFVEQLKDFATARIDIKLLGNVADFELQSVSDNQVKVTKPPWIQFGGKGYVIESYAGGLNVDFKIKTDGNLRISLRGKDIRGDDDKRIPSWITYSLFRYNGITEFAEAKYAWHDKPITISHQVKAGETVHLYIEWKPCKMENPELPIRLMDTEKKLKSSLSREASLKNSVSFRTGRAITWFPRKIRGGVRCFKEHGPAYTVKRFFWHITH